MVEKDKLVATKIKYNGIFNFTDFYKFCYEWLRDETGLVISEDKYSEKLTGDSKGVEIEWTGKRKLTDYFGFEVKVSIRIIGLTSIEVTEGTKKIKTNKGIVELSIKGTLLRDYDGKFEKNAFQKFLRGVYERYVIKSKVDQFEEKVMSECDDFLSQAKAYLDLMGKR